MRNGSRKRALVAGGAGFIGSHLCEALVERGMDVICLDNFLTGQRSNLRALQGHLAFDLIEADVVRQLPRTIARRHFDEIYNLACAASPPLYQADPEHTMLTSVLGTQHLLALAERCGAAFLLASTSEVYGDPLVHPQREDYYGNVNPTGPRACYDEGKRAAESLAFDYDRAGRGVVRVARIFNTYGPRLSVADGRVVSNVVVQALAEESITVYGNGDQTRSFCYVTDMVDGLIRLMRHAGPQPGPVNLGNPREITINELVAKILRLSRSSSVVARRPLPQDDPRRRRPDIGRARRILEWTPSVTLTEGLRRTIRWFEQQPVEPERPVRAMALQIVE